MRLNHHHRTGRHCQQGSIWAASPGPRVLCAWEQLSGWLLACVAVVIRKFVGSIGAPYNPSPTPLKKKRLSVTTADRCGVGWHHRKNGAPVQQYCRMQLNAGMFNARAVGVQLVREMSEPSQLKLNPNQLEVDNRNRGVRFVVADDDDFLESFLPGKRSWWHLTWQSRPSKTRNGFINFA